MKRRKKFFSLDIFLFNELFKWNELFIKSCCKIFYACSVLKNKIKYQCLHKLKKIFCENYKLHVEINFISIFENYKLHIEINFISKLHV